MNQTVTYIIGGISILMLVIAGWFFFFRPSSQTLVIPADSGFGIGDSRSVVVPTTDTSNTDGGTISVGVQSSQKIFKVADGPITSATLVQTSHPTTTLARFVLQENGHVFDLVLDSAGAIPHAISNTTIPGGVHGVWSERGGAVVLQYMDAGIVKTVYLGFPTATTTAPVRIKFLPDNVTDLASSPDGQSIVYLLRTAAGSDAYLAKSDGTNSKKLFSVPFSELQISWPAQSTQLVWTKSAGGVPGAAFSVNAQSGGVVPLLYAPGLTVGADRSFAHVLYQNTSGDGAASFVHDTKTGKDTALSFEPAPERCIWSTFAASIVYCATPLEKAPAGYLDLWHKGAASMVDTIISFNFSTGGSNIITTPGTVDGGTPSDIAEMAVSPDDHYLLFIKKSDRSLWAVRLTD